VEYFAPIDHTVPGFGEWVDELPLWSAPFGLLLLEHVPLKSGITVLDVGAGTGFLTLELAQRCGADSRVIAVDPWASAMERLRAKCRHLGLTNVILLTEDAASLDLPDESLDLVVSNLGLNNFDDAAEILEVCHQAARPGSHIVLTTNLVGHLAEFYAIFRDTLRELEMKDAIPALEAHENHRATVAGTTELLNEAGYEMERVVEESFRMRFANGSALLRHYFIRLGFLGGWRGVVPQSEAARVFSRLEKNLNQLANREGDLTLTVPMACFVARKGGSAGRAP
jgi:precorrin-6B methylase 2